MGNRREPLGGRGLPWPSLRLDRARMVLHSTSCFCFVGRERRWWCLKKKKYCKRRGVLGENAGVGLGEEGAEDSDESRARAGLVLRELAQPPTSGDIRSSWLSFARAARRGLRGGPLGLATASGGDSGARSRPPGQLCRFLPSPNKGLLSGQSSLLFFITGLMCGFLPTQLSFLGSDDSPRTCPIKPCSPARQGVPPTVPSLVSREQMVWSHRAVRHRHPSCLRAEAAAVGASVCGDRFLFFLYLLLG